jgi:hypothetical protein
LVLDLFVVVQVPILALVLFPKESIFVVDFGEVPWNKMECDGVQCKVMGLVVQGKLKKIY